MGWPFFAKIRFRLQSRIRLSNGWDNLKKKSISLHIYHPGPSNRFDDIQSKILEKRFLKLWAAGIQFLSTILRPDVLTLKLFFCSIWAILRIINNFSFHPYDHQTLATFDYGPLICTLYLRKSCVLAILITCGYLKKKHLVTISKIFKK